MLVSECKDSTLWEVRVSKLRQASLHEAHRLHSYGVFGVLGFKSLENLGLSFQPLKVCLRVQPYVCGAFFPDLDPVKIPNKLQGLEGLQASLNPKP